MIDFSSALYLGLKHSSHDLPPWTELTLGRPAALSEPPGALQVAQRLAQIQGCEQALLMPSTLHLFWDLFGSLSRQPVSIFLDRGAYPVARWGVERAAALGVSVRAFRHYSPDALMAAVKQQAFSRKRPVVVADGFCPTCSRPAPIAAYLEIVRSCGGLLVLDNTQAFGIFGERRAVSAAYGSGGGGMLRWWGAYGPDILILTSMAKGFGVPLAVLSGSARILRRFTAVSDTRVHCSPPSIAVTHAAGHALAVNRQRGESLRRHLAQRVQQFRDGLRRLGCSVVPSLFPVQSPLAIAGADPVSAHRALAASGVRAVLTRPRLDGQPRLSFLITARHTRAEIDYCLAALDELAGVSMI